MSSPIEHEIAQLSYEDARNELTKLVDQMQTGKLPLDLAVRQFERGQALAQHCEMLLRAASERVSQQASSPTPATTSAPWEQPKDDAPF